jgi:anaerobic selenocysteine-containing dehydrogenase
VYEEEDIYRGQDRRDVILMNPRDVARLKLSHDQAVTIESKTGRLENIRIREFPEIKAGNVLMYYPEANVLVSRSVDPKSKTPAFKGELVRVLVDE